jgi:hypothetical protein
MHLLAGRHRWDGKVNTVACRYNEQKRLGTSFFFFSKGCGEVFFTSLAVQLAINMPYPSSTKLSDYPLFTSTRCNCPPEANGMSSSSASSMSVDRSSQLSKSLRSRHFLASNCRHSSWYIPTINLFLHDPERANAHQPPSSPLLYQRLPPSHFS